MQRRGPLYVASYAWHRVLWTLTGNRRARWQGVQLTVPRRLPQRLDYLWAFRCGEYEGPERRVALASIDPSLPLMEIGSGLGGVSLFLNRALERPERHVALEMNAALLHDNAANRDANGCRYDLVHAALAYNGASVGHGEHGEFMGRAVQEGVQGDVRAVTVEEVARQRGWTRFNLVLDIEGMEVEMLRHEMPFLRRHAARLVLEVHPDGAMQEACDALQQLVGAGFRMVGFEGDTFAFHGPSEGAAPKRKAPQRRRSQ